MDEPPVGMMKEETYTVLDYKIMIFVKNFMVGILFLKLVLALMKHLFGSNPHRGQSLLPSIH
jgi:hypothetical protein